MTFVKDDIPTACFIEHFILMDAQQRGALNISSEKILREFDVTVSYVAPFIQIRVLTLLYCLLVYPSEVWKKTGAGDEVLRMVQEDKDFDTCIAPLLDRATLKNIRNSVAHGDIEFNTSSLCFVGQTYRETFTFDDLTLFLLILGRSFHLHRKNNSEEYLQ